MLFISFHEAVGSEAVRSEAVRCEAVRSEAVRFIDKWFVHKQVVMKLHDQLIAIQDYLYQLNLFVVYLNISKI